MLGQVKGLIEPAKMASLIPANSFFCLIWLHLRGREGGGDWQAAQCVTPDGSRDLAN